MDNTNIIATVYVLVLDEEAGFENTRLILEDMWLALRDCLHRFLTAVWFALTILGLDYALILWT